MVYHVRCSQCLCVKLLRKCFIFEWMCFFLLIGGTFARPVTRLSFRGKVHSFINDQSDDNRNLMDSTGNQSLVSVSCDITTMVYVILNLRWGQRYICDPPPPPPKKNSPKVKPCAEYIL